MQAERSKWLVITEVQKLLEMSVFSSNSEGWGTIIPGDVSDDRSVISYFY